MTSSSCCGGIGLPAVEDNGKTTNSGDNGNQTGEEKCQEYINVGSEVTNKSSTE